MSDTEVRPLASVAGACAVLFVLLAFAAHHAGNLPFDRAIDSALYRVQGTRGHKVATAATFFGSAPGVALVGISVAIWLSLRRRVIVAVFVIAAPIVAAVAETLAKKAVDRFAEPTGIGDQFRNQHFPSGHVAGFTALAVAVVLVASLQALGGASARLGLLSAAAFAGVVLVAVSRISLGAHFFTDTVGGFLLGTGISCSLAAALIRFSPPSHPGVRL